MRFRNLNLNATKHFTTGPFIMSSGFVFVSCVYMYLSLVFNIRFGFVYICLVAHAQSDYAHIGNSVYIDELIGHIDEQTARKLS